MSSVNFDELFKNLEDGVESLAKDTIKNYECQAKDDGQQALVNIKTNLSHWSQEVENGALTVDDLKFLLQSEEGLDEMIGLKQAGLAAIEVDKFRNGLINMVVSTMTGFIRV